MTTGGATSATEVPDDGTFASDMAWAEAVDAAADRITHTSRLVETHRITLPAGATGDNVAVARLHAEAYARSRGFELGAGDFSVLGINGPDGRSGVQFTLTVGVGDIHQDQRVPGVLDRWTWSGGAVEWWRKHLGDSQAKLLSLVDAQGNRRTGRLTGIRPIEGDPNAVSVSGEFVDAPGGFHGRWLGNDALNGLLGGAAGDGRPPWLRRADGWDEDGE